MTDATTALRYWSRLTAFCGGKPLDAGLETYAERRSDSARSAESPAVGGPGPTAPGVALCATLEPADRARPTAQRLCIWLSEVLTTNDYLSQRIRAAADHGDMDLRNVLDWAHAHASECRAAVQVRLRRPRRGRGSRNAAMDRRAVLYDGPRTPDGPVLIAARLALYVGGWRAAEPAQLHAHAITYVLSLYAPSLALERVPGVVYSQHLIDDVPGQALRGAIDAARRQQRLARAAGGRLLVHCKQGVSRSVAVALALMMDADAALGYEGALAAARRRHPSAQPNEGFALQLRNERVVGLCSGEL